MPGHVAAEAEGHHAGSGPSWSVCVPRRTWLGLGLGLALGLG
jgi:hypothetical protein